MEGLETIPISGNPNRRQDKAHIDPVQLAGQHTD